MVEDNHVVKVTITASPLSWALHCHETDARDCDDGEQLAKAPSETKNQISLVHKILTLPWGHHDHYCHSLYHHGQRANLKQCQPNQAQSQIFILVITKKSPKKVMKKPAATWAKEQIQPGPHHLSRGPPHCSQAQTPSWSHVVRIRIRVSISITWIMFLGL